MWTVVAHALLARRGQTVIVAVIALLASAAVVIAPWYAVLATQRVGVAAVAGAPVSDRLISVSWWTTSDDQLPQDPIADLRKLFAPKGFTSVGGGAASGRVSGPDGSVGVQIAYREKLCAHLVLTGSCPTAADEIAVSRALADQLGAGVGDVLKVAPQEGKPLATRVVAVYQVADPTEAYWGDGGLVGLGDEGADGNQPPVMFTANATLAHLGQVTYTDDLVAAPPTFATADVDQLRTTMDNRLNDLRAQQYTVSVDGLDALLGRIARDRQNVVAGTAVGVATLLLLTWFTLVVVLREAIVQVRRDAGWWRLHGAPSGRGWLLVLGQSAVPLVVGALVGTGLGILIGPVFGPVVGRVLGPVFGPGVGGTIQGGARGTAWAIALILVASTVVGGLVVAVAAQVGTLRTPVRDLLRRVPARHGRRARSLVDLVVVVIAAAAVGRALTAGDTEGLTLFAPGLVVLALALMAGWGVPALASAVANRALHAGRLAPALVAAAMARRPGGHRLFALVTVMVALLTTAAMGWDAGSRTRWERAALETGADRVVTVAPVDPARLLAAVRRVDPSGRQAMAVVQRTGTGTDPSMLAVDSARLSVVAGWRSDFGGTPAQLARALRPTEPNSIRVDGRSLVVRAAAGVPAKPPAKQPAKGPSNGKGGTAGGTASGAASGATSAAAAGGTADTTAGRTTDKAAAKSLVQLRIRLRALATGKAVDVVAGPLTGKPADYRLAVPTCAHGCRLVGVQVVGAPKPGQPGRYADAADGAWVRIDRLAAASGTAHMSGALRDPARWRTALGPRDLGPAIAGEPGHVLLTIHDPPGTGQLVRDDWAYVSDTPLPLPIVTAGWAPEDTTDELRVAPLSGAAVPARVVGTARLAPSLGRHAVMVDLGYADRMVPFPLAWDNYQVWLSPTAPAGILDELRHAGLTPLTTHTLAERLARLDAEGSAVGQRFELAITLLGLLLISGAVLVHAAQERAGRAAELAALRAQGLPSRTIRVVGYAGLAAVLGAAVVVGLAAGMVGAAIARALSPGFVDGWYVLPTAPFGLLALGAVAVVALVVLGVCVAVTGTALVRRTGEGRSG